MASSPGARVERLLEKNAERLALAQERLADLENSRSELYLRARESGEDGKPLVTFRRIAEIYGITEAAVMQKHARVRDEAAAALS